jgi:PhnB protein
MADYHPKGGVTPYLSVDGARKAIDFYKIAFGAVERETMAGEDGQRLMHAQVDINGTPIFLSDFFPDYGYPAVPPQAFNIHIHVDDAQTWWDRAVAAGCTVTQPLEKQFWGDIYGQLKDPFGVTWAIGEATAESE